VVLLFLFCFLDRVEQAKRVAAVLQRREEMQKLCLDLVPLGKRKTRHEEKGWKAGSTSEEHRKRIREMKKGMICSYFLQYHGVFDPEGLSFHK